MLESDQRPRRCQRRALTTELIAQIWRGKLSYAPTKKIIVFIQITKTLPKPQLIILYVRIAPIAQWTEQSRPKGKMRVRFFLGARRGGRVAECTGFENRKARKGLVGSNPTLSAKFL